MHLVHDSRTLPALALFGALLLPLSCGDDGRKHPPVAGSSGGSGNTGATGNGGSGNGSSKGGTGSGAMGQGASGNASGGQSGSEGGSGGAGPDPEGGTGASGSEEGGSAGDGAGGATNRGGASNRGGGSSRGGGTNRGGAGNLGGAGNGGGVGGKGGAPAACPSDDVIEPPAGLNGVCDPKASFGAGMLVDVPNLGTELISVTPDELTLLWYAQTSGPLTSYVADRDDPDAAFSNAQDLPGRDALALSPNGLRMVTATADQRALTLMTRTARGQLFASADAAEFANVNADAASRNQSFAAVVIAPSDRELYYLLIGADAEEHPLRVSRRSGSGAWPVGTALSDCELAAQGTNTRIPTGISADGLTLFYYDEITLTPRAAYRSTANGPIVWVQALNERENAQPNQACDRLYSTGISGPVYANAQ